jgi:hypothetical protein
MRQITIDAVRAFNNNYNFKRSNTEVRAEECFNEGGEYTYTELRLHGNLIAYAIAGVKSDCGTPAGLYICDGGWQSVTTKERLNGLSGVHIEQRNYIWYLNGVKWNGETIKI